MTPSAQERFRVLFEDAYRPLLAYARRRIADVDAAEDVVAETFAIAWRRIDDVPDGDAARAYLFGIARRVLANHRRSGRRRWRLVSRIVREPDPSTDPGPVLADPRVAAALGALSETDREVLRLAAWDGLSNQQIAAVLDLSPSGVASRLQRARQRLAAELTRLGVERTPSREGGTA